MPKKTVPQAKKTVPQAKKTVPHHTPDTRTSKARCSSADTQY